MDYQNKTKDELIHELKKLQQDCDSIKESFTRSQQLNDDYRRQIAIHTKMIANIGDIIVIIDKDGINKYKSPNVEKHFGWKPTDVLGQHTLLNIHPDDKNSAHNFLNSLVKVPNSIGTHECRYRCKDNTYKWIQITISNFLHDPEINGLLGNYHDITDRKEAEEAMKESDWKFRALFEKGPIGVAYHVMVNDANDSPIDYFFLDANETYCELTGVDPRGKFVTEAFPGIENDPFDWIGVFGKVARTDETIRFETYLEFNKRWYDCVGYQYKPDHFVAAFFEITKRKQAELQFQAMNEKLNQINTELIAAKEIAEESEKKFRTFFDTCPDGIAMTTITGEFIEANHALLQQLGLSSDEINNLNFSAITPSKWSKQEVDNIVYNIETGIPLYFEKEFIKKNGEIYPIAITGWSIKDEKGTPKYLGAFVKDISERKLMDAMFHDIIDKNPLSIQIVDKDGFTIKTNAAHTQLFGMTPPSGFSMFEELQRIGFADFILRAKNGEIVYFPDTYYNVQHINPQFLDKPTWVKAVLFSLKDIAGNPERFVFVHEDITNRKEAEKELLKSIENTVTVKNQLLANLENTPNVAIQWYDEQGRVIYWNNASSVLYGFTSDEAMGKTLDLLIHTPEDAANFLNIIADISCNGNTYGPYEAPIKKADGSPGWVVATTFMIDMPDNKKGFVCMDVDITDRKHAEHDLIAAKEKAEQNNKINEARLNLIQYSEKHTIDEILEETLNIAEKLSNSKIGFFHFVEDDQINLLLQSWSTGTKQYYCNAQSKGLHYPIDKAGIWVECVYERKPVIHNNYQELSHKNGLPDGHAPLIRELVVPIIYNDIIKAIIGIGNKETNYNQTDIENISLLAYLAWEIVEKKKINDALVAAKENAEQNANALKHSHDLMHYIIEHNRGAIAVHDKNYKYIYVSQRYLKDYKIEDKNIIGKHHYEVLPDIPQKWRDVHKRALAGEVLGAEEDSYQRDDGTLEWTRWECRPWYEADQSIGGFIVYTEIITPRKNMELELKAAKEKAEESEQNIREIKLNFETFFNTIDDFLFVLDEQANIIHCNKTVENRLGYTHEELIGKTGLFVHPEERRNEAARIVSEMLNGKAEFCPVPLITKQGAQIPVETRVKYGVWDGKTVLYGVSKDISKLKLSEEKFSEVFYLNPSACGLNDLNTGKYIEVNDAFYKLFGFTKEETIGHTATELGIMPPHTKAAILSKANSFGSLYNVEAELRAKNGDIKNVLISAKNIQTQDFAYRYTVLHDITEIKKAKEKAEESDRLKTAFLQNMSHEIRTPMNAICGFSDMLQQPGLTDEKRKNFVSIIQNSSYQLLSIVTDILTISSLETKQEKPNISKVCINNMIVELLSIFKQQSVNQNISLYAKKELTDIQSEVLTDRTKITQVLTNLLTNALKFTHEGFIEFGYGLTGAGTNLCIQFYVKDSGIGIKPEFHEKIFERFRQADKSIHVNYGGTGLGLSISKGFIELLGGKIWVHSEPGKGSTFYFTIPYKSANEVGFYIPSNKPNLNQLTVLVAEDEEYNFMYLEELLMGLGVKILHAKNGIEAVEMCKSNQNINLVLMDIKMPLMTGDKAAIFIKEFRPDLPIIAQSAYALEHEIDKFSGIFEDYVTKPIREAVFKQIVMKYIDKIS